MIRKILFSLIWDEKQHHKLNSPEIGKQLMKLTYQLIPYNLKTYD